MAVCGDIILLDSAQLRIAKISLNGPLSDCLLLGVKHLTCLWIFTGDICTVTFYLPLYSGSYVPHNSFPPLSLSLSYNIANLFHFISYEIVVTRLSTHHWAQLSQFEWICSNSHLLGIINGYSDKCMYIKLKFQLWNLNKIFIDNGWWTELKMCL